MDSDLQNRRPRNITGPCTLGIARINVSAGSRRECYRSVFPRIRSQRVSNLGVFLLLNSDMGTAWI
jgi:hypothetical protein